MHRHISLSKLARLRRDAALTAAVFAAVLTPYALGGLIAGAFGWDFAS